MSESLRTIFVRNLKSFRRRRKLSQEKLSYAIDMGMNYVNQMENKGSFPSPEVIDRLADVLHVRPVQFFDETESPENLMASRTDDLVAELTERICERLRADIRTGIADAIAEQLGKR